MSLFFHYRKLFVSYNVKNAPRGCDHRTEENCISNCAVMRKEGKPTLFYEKLQQVVAEIKFPSVFGFVPWGHHIEIVTKCKTIEEALFYVRKTIEESWSRRVLIDNMQEYKRMVSVVKEEGEEVTASFCKVVLSTERWFKEIQKHRIK